MLDMRQEFEATLEAFASSRRRANPAFRAALRAMLSAMERQMSQDERQASAKIEITTEMIAAGVAALENGRGAYHDEMLVMEVYTAMRLRESHSEAKQALGCLIGEISEVNAEIAALLHR